MRILGKVYSQRGFFDHFKVCPEAQRLWKSSEWGTRSVRLPMYVLLTERTMMRYDLL